MAINVASKANVVGFPRAKKHVEQARKAGLNQNKEGSSETSTVKVYVDFIYLGERVREPAGLEWTEENARTVREQVDKIFLAIKDGTFRFAEVFPSSKDCELFTKNERPMG